jgi:hypothetical protein
MREMQRYASVSGIDWCLVGDWPRVAINQLYEEEDDAMDTRDRQLSSSHTQIAGPS